MKDNYQEEKLALRIDETDDVRQGDVKTFSSSEGALSDLTTQSSFDRPSRLKRLVFDRCRTPTKETNYYDVFLHSRRLQTDSIYFYYETTTYVEIEIL